MGRGIRKASFAVPEMVFVSDLPTRLLFDASRIFSSTRTSCSLSDVSTSTRTLAVEPGV
jgi:hypothetical protein